MVLVAAGKLALQGGRSPTTSRRRSPTWIIFASYGAMAFGTSIGGWRIVKTMGMGLTHLKPVGGFCAEVAGAITLFGATALKIPVSTTHTITGAIRRRRLGDEAVGHPLGARHAHRVRMDLHDPGRRARSARGRDAARASACAGKLTSMATPRTGVIVIGGGHNGLVTAGLLAKRGVAVTVLERRDVVGGAAITEQPWGPAWKMTALSYVVSLMPPVDRERAASSRGSAIKRVSAASVLSSPYPDGRYADDVRRPRAPARARSASSPRRDADEMVRWDAWLGRLGAVLGPLLTTVPPRLGRKRPADLLAALGVAWKMRKLDERGRRRPDAADVDERGRPPRGALRERSAIRGVLSVSWRDRHVGRAALARHRRT